MDLKVLSCVVILGHVWGSFQVAHTKSLRLNGRYRQRSKDDMPCGSHTGIPKIVHHIFLDGEAAYWRNATLGDEFTPNFYPRKKDQGDKNATFRHEWKTGCQRLMPDWRPTFNTNQTVHGMYYFAQFRFWDMEAALKLIREQYSWFLPTFEGYGSVVAKGDALRPLILHAHGGMYVDLDVECYRPVDAFLEGHDLVLQAEEHNNEALINAVMASTARHPLWLDVVDLMMQRAGSAHNVLYATGPQVVSEAYKSFVEASDPKARRPGPPGRQRLTPHVYQLGEFYLPCNWLSQELCAEVDKTEPKPANLAGFHHWAGSWKVIS